MCPLIPMSCLPTWTPALPLPHSHCLTGPFQSEPLHLYVGLWKPRHYYCMNISNRFTLVCSSVNDCEFGGLGSFFYHSRRLLSSKVTSFRLLKQNVLEIRKEENQHAVRKVYGEV